MVGNPDWDAKRNSRVRIFLGYTEQIEDIRGGTHSGVSRLRGRDNDLRQQSKRPAR